jgi:hypothetical protein
VLAAPAWAPVTLTPSTAGNLLALNGVSARTDSDAWAVGFQYPNSAGPAAFHWTGSGWTAVGTPSLAGLPGSGAANQLFAVSASSATDAWAVGQLFTTPRNGATLLEHWNGSAWSVDTADSITAGGAALTGVLDLSPANAYAIGRTRTTNLFEHWNGTAWSAVTLPDPNFGASGIAGQSASDIWAVGTSFDPATRVGVAEAMHFNGGSWTVVPFSATGITSPVITGVTEISPSNVWAVGYDASASPTVVNNTLIEHWTGSGWSIVPSPSPGNSNRLVAVAGRSATDVYAIGNATVPGTDDPIQPENIVLRWNGSTWADDSAGVPATVSVTSAATFPGAALEWIAGTGVVLSHS